MVMAFGSWRGIAMSVPSRQAPGILIAVALDHRIALVLRLYGVRAVVDGCRRGRGCRGGGIRDILATQPHHGSTRVRNNFFTDYLWAIKGGRGEDLSASVQAEVDFWDATDP